MDEWIYSVTGQKRKMADSETRDNPQRTARHPKMLFTVPKKLNKVYTFASGPVIGVPLTTRNKNSMLIIQF